MTGTMIGQPVGSRMPAGFVGHGSPRTAENEEKAGLWRMWGNNLPEPRAMLVVSAHWEEGPLTLGRTDTHAELLYDFSGFPEELYRLQYPAPGAPLLADRVESLLAERWAVARADRPLDHGAWMPLRHMFPEPRIPVLQISMPSDFSDQELYDLGKALKPLRDDGVLLLGSGNIVHDVRLPSAQRPMQPGYAVMFDWWVRDTLERRDDIALLNWMSQGPMPCESHPTPEHFRPLLVPLGVSRDERVAFPVEGFEHGTVSMRCAQFG